MVSLEKIRADMQHLLERDKQLHNVDVHAESIDEALADAAVQLDTKAADLEYEVIEKGSSGFLGFGKKPWRLRIYENPNTVHAKRKSAKDDLFGEDEESAQEKIIDRDGTYYVRHFGDRIMLKVLLPSGAGKAVDGKDVMTALTRPDTISV